MTCIAGIAHAGVVYLGGDSAAFCGDSVSRLLTPKVFVRNEVAIGTAGMLRTLVEMRTGLAFPAPPKPRRLLEQWAARELLPACIASFERAKISSDGKGGDLTSSLLIGARGVLMRIRDDGTLAIIGERVEAIGAGGYEATGALHGLERTKMSPRERLAEALRITARLNAMVRGPFKIVSVGG